MKFHCTVTVKVFLVLICNWDYFFFRACCQLWLTSAQSHVTAHFIKWLWLLVKSNINYYHEPIRGMGTIENMQNEKKKKTSSQGMSTWICCSTISGKYSQFHIPILFTSVFPTGCCLELQTLNLDLLSMFFPIKKGNVIYSCCQSMHLTLNL